MSWKTKRWRTEDFRMFCKCNTVFGKTRMIWNKLRVAGKKLKETLRQQKCGKTSVFVKNVDRVSEFGHTNSDRETIFKDVYLGIVEVALNYLWWCWNTFSAFEFWKCSPRNDCIYFINEIKIIPVTYPFVSFLLSLLSNENNQHFVNMEIFAKTDFGMVTFRQFM